MKKQTKNHLKIRNKKNVRTVRSSVFGRLKLIEHKHTGKVVHHQHTSHVTLSILLIITGFFIYISNQIAVATQQVASGSVSVSLIVPGDPPSAGATITSPSSGLSVKGSPVVKVDGTCQADSYVVLYINSMLSGSTTCTDAGLFSINISLAQGQNIVTALNYDNLNQAGPATPAVTVSYTPDEPIIDDPIDPILPTKPVLIPSIENEIKSCADYNYQIEKGANDGAASVISICSEPPKAETCDDYKLTKELPTGGEPHVQIVCTTRFANANEKKKIGVLAWGGTPPYALSLDWGDERETGTLLSIQKPSYVVAETSYAVLGVYTIKAILTDSKVKTAVAESSMEINGKEINSENFLQYVKNSLNVSWFDTPVPLYLTAVAITLGFWLGDIFARSMKSQKLSKRRS